MDPTHLSSECFFSNSLKIALLFMGGGLGFLTALVVDEYLLIGIDNPAIYAGCVLLFSGTGLIIYHKFFK